VSFENFEILKAVWLRTRFFCYVTPRNWLMVSDILKEWLDLKITLSCVIPVVCVTNEREESVVNQHNYFRRMLYSNNETTCFGL